VHIIEWLRPDDRRTGSELLDELEPLGIRDVVKELQAIR
jgi:hypothetical protein